jgi:hypothetical protein
MRILDLTIYALKSVAPGFAFCVGKNCHFVGCNNNLKTCFILNDLNV